MPADNESSFSWTITFTRENPITRRNSILRRLGTGAKYWWRTKTVISLSMGSHSGANDKVCASTLFRGIGRWGTGEVLSIPSKANESTKLMWAEKGHSLAVWCRRSMILDGGKHLGWSKQSETITEQSWRDPINRISGVLRTYSMLNTTGSEGKNTSLTISGSKLVAGILAWENRLMGFWASLETRPYWRQGPDLFGPMDLRRFVEIWRGKLQGLQHLISSYETRIGELVWGSDWGIFHGNRIFDCPSI